VTCKEGEGTHIRPSKTIWLWKFCAIQRRFKGSLETGCVVLRRWARLDACREQIQPESGFGMQKPMYPTRTSREGVVELVETRVEKVLEMEGFTCAAFGWEVLGVV
jgi:hypothetical protein